MQSKMSGLEVNKSEPSAKKPRNDNSTQAEHEFIFDKSLTLDNIRRRQSHFVTERNWNQFHLPRNILLDLVAEVGKLAELFQWRGEVEVGVPGWTEGERQCLSHELSDVLLCLIQLAHKCRIDLPTAAMQKIAHNERKYPVEMVYGKSKKYTEYPANGAGSGGGEPDKTAADSKMSGLEVNKSEPSATKPGNDNSTHTKHEFIFDRSLTLEDIRRRQSHFVTERNWNQFHLPRNILLAMVAEVGELAELFQWKGEVEVGIPGWTEGERQHLGREMSDVLLYLIQLAHKCHINLPTAAMQKIAHNERKYPVEMVYGKSKKYTEYPADGAGSGGGEPDKTAADISTANESIDATNDTQNTV